VGMTEYLRALGFVYPQFFLERGGDLFICHSHCDYHGSARFDEDVDVHTRIARLGRSSVGFDFQLRCEEELLTSGEIIYVFADPEARRSRALPHVFRAAVRAYEPVDPQA
ncbi:MAG: acyl-CoA thioesterase, partial [Sinobacteraceae bacterium]|nr:acyl-CoA thioesterase [Nevskiaceae bacterium]